jgi:hypothetical protein
MDVIKWPFWRLETGIRAWFGSFRLEARFHILSPSSQLQQLILVNLTLRQALLLNFNDINVYIFEKESG